MDNSSVKSGSVIISSSSNPEQGQGQVADMSGQGTSAIKGQSASNVWGAGFNSGEESSDSNMTWGTNPVSSQMNPSGWGNPPTTPTSSMNNQGHNMQMSHSGGSVDHTNQLGSGSPGPPSALGWDINNVMVGGAMPPSSSAGRAVIGSSGAQTVPSSQAPGSVANSMSWPISPLTAGLPGLAKQQAATDSTWGNGSTGNSVIGSGLSISTSAAAPNSMDTRGTGTDHWGGSSNAGGGASGWGTPDPAPPGRSDSSGWGSPNGSPLPNAGTEEWGQSDSNRTPHSSWGQQPDTKLSAGSGWGQSDNRPPPSAAPGGWGSVDSTRQAASSGWGEPDSRGAPMGNRWGQPGNTSSTSSVWGATPNTRPPSQSQWGPGPSGAGAANPQQGSGWGGANNGSGAASSNPQVNNPPNNVWAGSNPNRPGAPGQPPNAPQSQQPPPPPHPNQAQGPPPGPPNQYQNSPSTWAQAVGGNKGNNYGVRPPPPPIPPPPVIKDDYVSRIISCNEGWGKRPVRQDTSWDTTELEPRRDPPPRRGSNSSSGSGEGSNWNTPKNGTAIWESAKENQNSNWDNRGSGGHSRSGSASSGPDWGSDNDNNHWNGPPNPSQGHNSNTWGGPPQHSNNNQWQGGNESNTWQDPNKTSNQWGGPNNQSNQWGGGGGNQSNQWTGNNAKEDNVWDRNGTQAWNSSNSSGGSSSGGKMETGTWEGGMSGRGSSSSSWGGDDIEPTGWEDSSAPDARRPNNEVDDGTSLWGNPEGQRKPHQWNPHSTAGPPPPHGPPQMPTPITGGGHNRQPSDERGISMWGQSSQPVQPSNPGWDAPSPPVGKMDDGSSYWGSGTPAPPHQGGAGWTDSWGGGAKPKTPTMGWGDPTAKKPVGGGFMFQGEMMQPGWGEDAGGAAMDETDMGNWEGSQESNSSWSSARDWNRVPRKKPMYHGANSYMGKPQPPQMRSKLLQQLMDMGFKKEDAQNALITNNMNLESAIAELLGGAPGNKRPGDEEKGRKLRPGDDVLDAQPDANQFVPPISIPNTPFSNAQSHMANSQVLPGGMLPAGVPLSSRGGNMGQSSINPLQQKILAHHQLAQTPAPGQLHPQGPAMRSQLSAQSMQQQAMQQQIVQQLQLAVRAGLISPQLLNQQLTPNMLVMLQNLLQLQTVLQRLLSQQSLLQQQKTPPMNPMTQRQQLETAHMIPKIKQQIFQLQQQIAQAQQALAKQPPVAPTDPSAKDMKDINSSLAGLSLGLIAQQQQQQQQMQQQQQSRLMTQWTQPRSEESSSSGDSSSNPANKAVGSNKPVSQSHSTPNLQNKDSSSSGLPFTDSTWSNSTSTEPWPSTSSSVVSASSANSEPKDSGSLPSSSDKDGEGNIQASSASTSSTPTSTSSQPSNLDADAANNSAAQGININDMIEEFIPGKPWQGITQKSVEEDPNMTPGSVSRSSLSVNTIKDDYLTSTLGKSSPSVTSETSSITSSTWSFGGSGFKTPSLSGDSKSTWSSSSSLNEGQSSAIASQLWGVGVPGGGSGKSPRPPPGLTNQKAWQRSTSWTPGDRAYNVSMSSNAAAMGNSGWGGQTVSNCLMLKNLTPQIDGSTLRTLCLQHGPLQAFYLNLNSGQALVRYGTKEEAIKAQKSLNACLLGNTTILAEFVSDSETTRLLEQLTAHAPTSAAPGMNSSPLSNLWSSQSGYSRAAGSGSGGGSHSQFPPSNRGDGQWNSASGFGGGGMWSSSDLWGSPSLDYNNTLLPGDLLGGQSM